MLKFIGSGSAFNTKLGDNSAYYKEGNQLFLIDCGSTTFKSLKEGGVLKGVENIHILVTHSHPDHIGSLGTLLLYSYFSMGNIGVKASVYSIGATGVKKILSLMGVPERYYNYVPTLHTTETRLKQFKDLAIIDLNRNKHVDEIFSFGYTMRINGKKVYYSGDVNELSKDIVDSINSSYFDYAYIDTCKAEYEDNVHLSLNKLAKVISPKSRSRVYCMHLDEGFNTKEAEDLGFNVASNEEL